MVNVLVERPVTRVTFRGHLANVLFCNVDFTFKSLQRQFNIKLLRDSFSENRTLRFKHLLKWFQVQNTQITINVQLSFGKDGLQLSQNTSCSFVT